MTSIAISSFINRTSTSQLQKESMGGRKTHWSAQEENDMRHIAKAVIENEFSQVEALKQFKQLHANKNTIGSLRPNKTPTAFRDKLARVVKELKGEK